MQVHHDINHRQIILGKIYWIMREDLGIDADIARNYLQMIEKDCLYCAAKPNDANNRAIAG